MARTAPQHEHLLHDLESHGVTHVRLGGFDIDGVLRGKYVTLNKFRAALAKGTGFCDVLFGWDSADHVYDNGTLTGWNRGYGDLRAVIDPASYRRVPWERDIPFFLLDFAGLDGSPYPASPRQLLQKIEGRARAQGFQPRLSAELEFFLFREDSHSIRSKGYRDLTPLTPGMFGYSALRAATQSDLVHGLLDNLARFGIEIDTIHTETGPGAYQVAIPHAPTILAADQAALFKTASKELLSAQGVMPTFMAKLSKDLPGCAGHVHQSLWRDGEPVFHDGNDPDGMSALMRHYVAGVLRLLPDMMALYCPTVNSYRRLVPGFWAPTNATWGHENRTTALRVVRGAGGGATRLENRLVGADLNPYLAFAASLGAGLFGIERGLALKPPVRGNAYELPPDQETRLPQTLSEAADRLDASKAARMILGDEFVDHFVATRRWEVRQARATVTDWELARYFEII